MSKPNLLGFASSVGIYRNKRIRDLRGLLAKPLSRKAPLSDWAATYFQVVMAYAGENQIDGNFAGYTTEDWCEIFAANHIHLTPSEANAIVKGFAQVGLFDNQKIRSWMKYNRHLADYEGIVKAKRLAGKLSAKKRQQEARNALQNPENPNGKHPQEPEKNGAENDSPRKQLWLIEKLLESAKGKAKKELLRQKDQLIKSVTGEDNSQPAAAPAPARGPARPRGDFQRALLKAARQAIVDEDWHIINESMVKALHAAGERIPDQVAREFSKLIEELEASNPVVG